MPLVRLDDSGLFVAEQISDSVAVERALNQIDHPIAGRLFVTREVDHGYGTYVWRVMVDNGDEPAECVTEWRDDSGRPLPLSSGLVGKVQRQIHDGSPDLVMQMVEANRRREQQVTKAVDEAFAEIAADVGPRLKETRSALLHRGVHLRRSRGRSLRSGRDALREAVGERLRRTAA